MNYQVFNPHPDLESIVRCYWTLEVPRQENAQKQRIIPDGFVELFFILGDDVKRYVSEDEFIIQPREMVLGQTTKPFYIEPTGYVNVFAVRFWPYGFTNLMTTPIKDLADKETPIGLLFGESIAKLLSQKIIKAPDTKKRIQIIEHFLFERLSNKATIDNIVKSTVDTMFLTGGNIKIKTIIDDHLPKRRQLERKFLTQVGVSPKQLGKIIRLQATLKMLLNQEHKTLTKVACENEYYDQSHFIKDFREFTGITPKEFFEDEKMALSSILYRK